MKRRARRRAAGPLPAMEVGYAFGFDAAHRFKGVPRGHKYGGVHGHSFQAEVVIRGVPRPPHGFVADFARLEKASLALRGKLDHTLLNEVEGLGTPSLENLCIWLWERLVVQFTGLVRVTVRRDSLGQSCTYDGTAQAPLRRTSIRKGK
ncbi:MAG TPA: 6-carboxytetrahydropterin synthase [Burkholderiales bacterium]|nr:6-carboxytetrahydropterin synthase [Burkholderiales bacterium]